MSIDLMPLRCGAVHLLVLVLVITYCIGVPLTEDDVRGSSVGELIVGDLSIDEQASEFREMHLSVCLRFEFDLDTIPCDAYLRYLLLIHVAW